MIGLLKKINDLFFEKNMGIRFGNFDPLQLIFGTIDVLLRKGLITPDEAKKIIKDALPPAPEMSEEEKNRILDSMITRTP